MTNLKPWIIDLFFFLLDVLGAGTMSESCLLGERCQIFSDCVNLCLQEMCKYIFIYMYLLYIR